MDEFKIKSVAEEDLMQYHRLASWSCHMYHKEFGTEAHTAQIMEKALFV